MVCIICPYITFLYHVLIGSNSNKHDLHLLEEIGISPDMTIREKKPTLKTVGLVVVASLRMQKLSQQWAEKKKLHLDLVRKLEGMRGRQAGRRSGVGVVKGEGRGLVR